MFLATHDLLKAKGVVKALLDCLQDSEINSKSRICGALGFLAATGGTTQNLKKTAGPR